MKPLKKKEIHRCKHTEVIYSIVRADSPYYPIAGTILPTLGKVVPTAFLFRKCACGHQEPFAYGERPAMKELKISVEERWKNNDSTTKLLQSNEGTMD